MFDTVVSCSSYRAGFAAGRAFTLKPNMTATRFGLPFTGMRKGTMMMGLSDPSTRSSSQRGRRPGRGLPQTGRRACHAVRHGQQ